MLRPRLAFSAKSHYVAMTVSRVLQFLLALVIVGVVYRYCWIDVSDPFKCGALLNKGQWLDPGPRWTSRNPFQNWQPPGCIMHEYMKKDIQDCFHKRRLVFVGDSTTRQIFCAVAKKMDQERAEEEISGLLDSNAKHTDLEFVSGGVSVQFIWDPWLNSTGLDQELKKYRAEPLDATIDEEDESAGLILLGAPGLWYARHSQENYFRDFRDTIDAIIPYMDHASGEEAMVPKSRPFPSRSQSPNFLLLAPIQVPWYPALSPSREVTITPEKIDQMNDYLQQVSQHSSADVVWSYSLMSWAGSGAYEESGLHIVNNVAHRKADILLNLRCNSDAASKGYPFNRTCCSNYTHPSVIQWIVLVLGLLLLPTLTYMRRHHIARISRMLPSAPVLNALAIFALVVCFCFYADRTQVFEKAQKQFRKREFLTACSTLAIAGLLSVKRNDLTASRKGAGTSQDDSFLSRTQTDEWKGWMQAFILIYHYTHASRTLWLYEIVRLLFASYLFLTGFGHTLYFLGKEDYSLKRIAGVLIRLNLLSCVLPYMMRTNYLFYYFAPLVSFWFLVIYFTLRIGNKQNSNLTFVFAKILLSVAFTTAFTMIPGVLEFIGTILGYTCGISWNMGEWRFRTFLDMYIVYVGMLTGLLVHRTSRLRSGSVRPTSIIDAALQLTIKYHTSFKTVTIALALGLLPGFWLLTRRSPNKEDYNWWQPYISFIPILSFVVLRNSHRVLRTYHSALFAWLGRCSLETYILQYHIWLAGDTTGLLRLGLWNHWVEAAILTLVFLWTSHATADATQVLANWIVNGNGNKIPTTNLGNGNFGLNAKASPSILPRVVKEKEEEVLEEAGKWKAKPRNCLTRFRNMDDLRRRLGIIGVVLWIANITYK
ncbi:putative O-acetyltransferase [Lachnellula hyalina]|uniref:Putative O-acetyltransferase n=1 Tax=Lachnellula hyalina TaxID=1316788 RepID=A0A8H8QVR8_9HELO|nr:putative O-acetyltransferase [Lachnellula hyalina]TVY22590.1 putative O-acetyltransferase [Lachnellula hyalina]